MVSVNRQLLLIVLASIFLFIQSEEAIGHWDMEARLWAEGGNEKFLLRIHNGEHANRKPTKKDLKVCFWIEDAGEGNNRLVSEKKCSTVIIKPDEWMTFEFSIRDIPINEAAKSQGKLKAGKYRAVAQAREQRGWFMKLILGAAMERVYNYFEVK